ncbi:MAG: restriction endonuclease subunit S, partial [Planctomycetes bacterium]|nr:restriction endonuclease subunit S [Planctomycetota bacterium]
SQEVKLGKLITIKHGFPFLGEHFSQSGDFVLLTPGNFFETGGYRDRKEKQKYYTGEFPEEYVLDERDLLLVMTEQAKGLLGSPLLVPESNKFLHNQRLGLVTSVHGSNCDPNFFFHLFNSRKFRSALQDSATGTKVRHTSPKKILDVSLSIPQSIETQQKIASRIESLDKVVHGMLLTFRKKSEGLSTLKQSLLQKAFTGELTSDKKAADRTLSEAGL